MTAQRLQAFFAHVAALKRMPRRGWVQRGVPDPESVGAHSFGVAALAAVTASGGRRRSGAGGPDRGDS